MHIIHHMKKEDSGLARATLELAIYEQKAGHSVCVKQPSDDGTGQIVYGIDRNVDVHSVHSQFPISYYFDDKPKFMWMHGEPLSSVGNGVSMKAICDLAPLMNAFICMKKDEHIIWNSIKKTYYVPKGVDLEVFKPLPGITEKLSGEPSVLYIENWRGQRNPLYLCIAMREVWKKYPKARLHLYNCRDKRMHETFTTLRETGKWWPFLRSLSGPVQDVNMIYNRVDMVASCLYPLYARVIEAFGAGKPIIAPGYREHDYPYTCELDPVSMSNAIIKCWEETGKYNWRKYAEENHDVKETVRQSVEIYQKHS